MLANQEKKPLPVPKLPCTGAQLPKKGRIEVIPEQDSTEMPVQTPLVQVLHPSPPKSLSPTRGHRQAEVTSLCPAAQHPRPGPSRTMLACGQAPQVCAEGPGGLSGCSEQSPGAPLVRCGLVALLRRQQPHSLPHGTAGTEWDGSRRACSELDHPTNT